MVTRLFNNLEALSLLFGDKKYLRLIRGTVTVEVLFVFGNESRSGFRSYWTEEDYVGFRFEVWHEEGNGTSSNYREFRNLVETLKDLGRKKGLDGSEVFICTDNMVSESIAVLGSSRSEIIFDLVV